MAVAADVPDKYDLVLNGEGYILDRTADPNAIHQYTPTFVDRQNVSGSYGDNQQEFWMVLSQNDWSGGEQQKYIRVNDGESRRRYWAGSAVDILTDGQVALARNTTSLSVSGTVVASCNWNGQPVFNSGDTLYKVNNYSTVVSIGTITSTFSGMTGYGMCSDDSNVFFAYPSGGTNGCIRQWNGSSFSNFAPSLGVSSVEMLGNVLYGAGNVSAGKTILYSFSTSGAATTLYTWQTADGNADVTRIGRIRRYGGSLLMHTLTQAGRIYQYDGAGVSEIAQMPPAFYPTEICVAEGIAFIGGSYLKLNTGTNTDFFHLPAVFFYVDGALNELWRADDYTSNHTSAGVTTSTANPVPWLGGVIWWDDYRGQLTYYDVLKASISGVSANTAVKGLGCFSGEAFFNGPSSGTAGIFADPGSLSSSGTVTTSLFDADSSLPKYWKSVKVDFDAPTGATVDLAYRLNDLSSSFTNLQTGAAAGTEYTVGQSARAITVKATLNKGSGGSPVLKRIYVRGVPILDSFRRDTYVLDCSGRDSISPVRLRDGTAHQYTGAQMVTNLRTAASSSSPFTVVDELGSYTGLIEPDSFRVSRSKDREYRVQFTVRQVS